MISTGDPGLDECLDGGYQQGALHVVVGGTGSGKTSWLRVAIQRALNEGKTVHIVDLEGAFRSFEREPHCSVVTRDLTPILDSEKIDLLVYDNLNLHHPPERGASIPTEALSKWLASSFIPMLKQMDHPVKLVSWLAPRSFDRLEKDQTPVLPRALNFSADVVFHLHRDVRDVRAVLRKNKFGLAGREFGYSLPDVRPIVRRTFWERLQAGVDFSE